MRRKDVSKWVGLMFTGLMVGLLLGNSLFAVPARAQIKVTYATYTPPATFPSVQMERWAKEVEKRTGGKVKVQTFPSGTLLGAKNMFEGVISGVADIGFLSMGQLPGLFPVSDAVDLPMKYTNTKTPTMVLYDLIEKYNPKEFEAVKIVTLCTCAPMQLMTKSPVRSLKDLKGMQIKVTPAAVDIIKILGGVPIALPMSETAEALQKGMVKGILSSLEILKDFNFSAYLPYATLEGMHVAGGAVIMNKNKWESFPDDVKKVINDMKREEALWIAQYMDDQVKESLDWSKKKYNHQVFELPEADRAQLPKVLKPITDNYVKRVDALGLPGAQILNDIHQLKKKYSDIYK